MRSSDNALQKLTLSNPIHKEIYESLTKDKQFLEELRRKATEALDSLPNAQSGRSVDNKGSMTYNKIKYSSRADFNKLRSKVPIPKKQRLSVWNSIVERNIDYLRTRGDELPSEYYAYNDDYIYFYFNNSAKEFEDFYVHSRISIKEKNRSRIERKVREIENIENARGYSDLVSFASEDSEGRRNSNYTIHERQSNVNQKYDSVFKAKGREPSNNDLSRSDGVHSQTGKGTDENVSENAGGVSPATHFSLKAPVEVTKDLIAVHNFKTADLRIAATFSGLSLPSIDYRRLQTRMSRSFHQMIGFIPFRHACACSFRTGSSIAFCTSIVSPRSASAHRIVASRNTTHSGMRPIPSAETSKGPTKNI